MADAFLDPELLAISEDQKNGVFMDDQQDIQRPTVKVEIPADNISPESPRVKDEEMADLFGDDDVDEDIVHDRRESTGSPLPSVSEDGLTAEEIKHRRDLEYAEDDGQEDAVIELKHAALSIPNIPIPRSSDGNNWVLRMPNFIKLDSKPFHPDTYVGPEQDDEALSGRTVKEKSMSIKLEVENTMRWRWVKDEAGEYRRQANSRIIRWNDGSLSLLLGKELFDVTQAVESLPPMPGGSQSQSQSQSHSLKSPTTSRRPQGLTYLVAQHKRSAILQAELAITGYLGLRPTGMQSETHRMLVRAVGQKHNKVARLRMAPDPVMDPEKEMQEIMKQANKKGRKMKTEDDKFDTSISRKKKFGRKRSKMGTWSDDEQEEPEYDGTDDDDDDMGSGRTGGKRSRPGEKKGAGEYQNDDFVVADSSEEDGDEDSPRKKKRRRSQEDEDAEGEDEDAEAEDVDALDELDAKIAQQEEDRKRSRAKVNAVQDKTPTKEKEPQDVEMDVESEEDDEEGLNIRRAGTGARKKRITIDEQDEDE